ncbi:hypothetical protein F-M6_0072 [Faustovirus]|nr:hypothetical protein F-LCD7_0071 [Faustovirus]QJX71835.1 hypothetical protein F-M6_0072 [Faustovirus]QJX72832.1 proliferating cell nuclear antigen [Faustovirus]QJX73338.1 proliferating cell nuclear antigen [Faustovirus]QJX73846.1 hypothetical protein F-E9_73 [Faustovirus]
MIYGKARSTMPMLKLILIKKAAPKPILPPEMILEILGHNPKAFLSVARWHNYEARKIIGDKPVTINVYAKTASFLMYTQLEGMAGLRYSA